MKPTGRAGEHRSADGAGVRGGDRRPDAARPNAARPDAARSGSGMVVEVSFGRGAVNVSAVAVGSLVWKTDDPEIRRRLEQSYNRPTIAKREKLSAEVSAKVGGLFTVTLRDGTGRSATATWDRPLERAQKFPLSIDLLREQFGRLGDTPYELGEVRVNGGTSPASIEPVMVPKSVLNDLRRQATAQLLGQRERHGRHAVVEPEALERMRAEIDEREYPASRGAESLVVRPTGRLATEAGATGGTSADPRAAASDRGAEAMAVDPASSSWPKLYVLARTMEQLEAMLKFAPPGLPRPAMVYCEFEDVRKYPAAVAAGRAVGMPIGLATVRVIKPGEEGLLKLIGEAAPDAALVRTLAGLAYFARNFPELPLVGDYALNISNEITADLFAGHGVVRMAPSYDLNWKQLKAMLGRFRADRFEQVIHQHMPMFHMEHCVFCHTLSSGKDYRDCGRPCDRHQVDLGDRANVKHPLVADVGCRNTVYNGTAQSAAEFAAEMMAQGIRHFRVELLRETGETATKLVERYARVLAGKDDGRSTWQGLKVLNQLGVVRGTLERLE
jgi:putative protease